MARFFVTASLAAVAVVFGVANLQVVEVKTVIGDGFRASLTLLLGAAFACGFVAATLLRAQRSARRWWRERAERRRSLDDESALLPPPPRIVWPGDERKHGRASRL
jgi:uncharacterized membrane protein YciS (DUF1049 family)